MCEEGHEVGISNIIRQADSGAIVQGSQMGGDVGREREREVKGIPYIAGTTFEELLANEDKVPIDYSREIFRAEPTLEKYAEYLCSLPTWKRTAVGFIGYGHLKPGSKVLLVSYNTKDPEIAEAVRKTLKKKGAARVDQITLDEGEDHLIRDGEEIDFIIRREPWWINPRKVDYRVHILKYAEENKYDVLIHGVGGRYPRATPDGSVKYNFRPEAFPWQSKEQFLSKATIYPPALHSLINRKAWEAIYKKGRNAKVRLTDPEGTDLEFTLFDKYFERPDAMNFNKAPFVGHLMSHPAPPYLPEADTEGVVSGTMGHWGSFPTIRVNVKDGVIDSIDGGGKYGDGWRSILEETRNILYPGCPRKGLFWLWEMAIGTNPKIVRPSDVLWFRSGSFEWERRRAGVIHCGFGTAWQAGAELWASQKGFAYGHLHVHLLAPTYELKATSGETIKVIENGRLTALDDPEVRDLAKRYGDPDDLLGYDWEPKYPNPAP
jgi:hypothetical protein